MRRPPWERRRENWPSDPRVHAGCDKISRTGPVCSGLRQRHVGLGHDRTVGQLNVGILKHENRSRTMLALPRGKLGEFLIAGAAQPISALLLPVAADCAHKLHPADARCQVLKTKHPHLEWHAWSTEWFSERAMSAGGPLIR